MIQLQPEEHVLVGKWEFRGGRVVPDTTAERINQLVAEQLVKVAASTDGWSELFIDPNDRRLWELSYPDSGQHGGGPPLLRLLRPDEASQRFNYFGETKSHM
jgi:hypothetical protein